jgi:hypothetical protein
MKEQERPSDALPSKRRPRCRSSCHRRLGAARMTDAKRLANAMRNAYFWGSEAELMQEAERMIAQRHVSQSQAEFVEGQIQLLKHHWPTRNKAEDHEQLRKMYEEGTYDPRGKKR